MDSKEYQRRSEERICPSDLLQAESMLNLPPAGDSALARIWNRGTTLLVAFHVLLT